jgi:outer membrane protein
LRPLTQLFNDIKFKMKKTIVLVLALMISMTSGVFAQKFGFCNSAALLAELPEVKQADSDLQAYQAQLTKKGQQMVQVLQTKAADLQKRQEARTISPKDFEAESAKLETEQAGIQEYEQQVYADLTKKREELYAPILAKVNQAMKDVSKENAYILVFDSSTQVLLYADESLDVTKLVKVKLGIAN